MAQSDEQTLGSLREWRDNIIAALKIPETTSAFGGMPDTTGGGPGVGRMGGRAQLLSELDKVNSLIAEHEAKTEDGPNCSSSLGIV